FLLAVALFVAHLLRLYSTIWFNAKPIDPFVNYSLLLIVVMLFGPIILDIQGFYDSPIDKPKIKSFFQIIRAMIYLSIIVSVCTIFLRLSLVARSVPLLFIVISTLILLVKERIIIRRTRRKALAGMLRDPVLLAGTPQDIAAFEQSLTPEQKLSMEIAD